jgi:hypothetical protein
LDGEAGTVALRSLIEAEIRRYIDHRPPGSTVHYNKVLGVIVDIDGIEDISGLTLDGGTSNVTTTTVPAQSPRLDALTLAAA